MKHLVERLLALREKGTALEREAVQMRLIKSPSPYVKTLLHTFEIRFDSYAAGKTLPQYIDQKFASTYLPNPGMDRFLEPLIEILVRYLTEEGGPEWPGEIKVLRDVKKDPAYKDIALRSCKDLVDVAKEVFDVILREKDLEDVPASQKPQTAPVKPPTVMGRPPARRPS